MKIIAVDGIVHQIEEGKYVNRKLHSLKQMPEFVLFGSKVMHVGLMGSNLKGNTLDDF